VLYHSAVCLPSVRADILEYLAGQGRLAAGEEPPRERVYPPVGTLALDRLCDMVLTEAHTLRQFDGDDSRVEPAALLHRTRWAPGHRR
jgi:mannosyl-3-phosphoglycerate synthase